jgi:hypothetical protein
MQRAKAFVFAAEEDFGITLVEAQACGTPVIAFVHGGASEIVRPLDGPEKPTGVFFMEQTPDAIVDAVNRFEALTPPIEPAACRRNAERFSTQQFRRSFKELVERAFAQAGILPGGHSPQLPEKNVGTPHSTVLQVARRAAGTRAAREIHLRAREDREH